MVRSLRKNSCKIFFTFKGNIFTYIFGRTFAVEENRHISFSGQESWFRKLQVKPIIWCEETKHEDPRPV